MIEAMEQRVLFNVVSALMSETIVSSTLPATTYNQSNLRGSVTFQATNNATDSQVGKVAIGIFISGGPLNVAFTGSYAILTSKLTTIALGPGLSRNYTLSVNIKKGKLALGTDILYAVIADPDGSDSESPAGPTLTVVEGPPIHFSDKIISAKPMFSVAASGTQEYADQMHMEMSIHNTGGFSDGNDSFSLFASTSPAFDSSATKIGHVVLTLTVPHNGTRNFLINFGGLPNLGNGQGESDFYIFVQVTDNLGDVTLGSFPKAVDLTLPRPT